LPGPLPGLLHRLGHECLSLDTSRVPNCLNIKAPMFFRSLVAESGPFKCAALSTRQCRLGRRQCRGPRAPAWAPAWAIGLDIICLTVKLPETSKISRGRVGALQMRSPQASRLATADLGAGKAGRPRASLEHQSSGGFSDLPWQSRGLANAQPSRLANADWGAGNAGGPGPLPGPLPGP